MTDISVVILQKNEAVHIKRCLEKLAPLEPRQIFVVDCYSTDGSDKIAAEMGAQVFYRAWPGLYAPQLNWAPPWTAAHEAPLSMRFSRQGYWSGLPLPSPFYILSSKISFQSLGSFHGF